MPGLMQPTGGGHRRKTRGLGSDSPAGERLLHAVPLAESTVGAAQRVGYPARAPSASPRCADHACEERAVERGSLQNHVGGTVADDVDSPKLQQPVAVMLIVNTSAAGTLHGGRSRSRNAGSSCMST